MLMMQCALLRVRACKTRRLAYGHHRTLMIYITQYAVKEWHTSCTPSGWRVSRDPTTNRRTPMYNILYIIGAIVVIIVVLKLLGLY